MTRHFFVGKQVSKHGGFTQSQFASSSREVLKSLDPSELSKPDLNLDTEDLPIERVLGCVWDCESDSFKFPHTVKSKSRPRTREFIQNVACSAQFPLYSFGGGGGVKIRGRVQGG